MSTIEENILLMNQLSPKFQKVNFEYSPSIMQFDCIDSAIPVLNLEEVVEPILQKNQSKNLLDVLSPPHESLTIQNQMDECSSKENFNIVKKKKKICKNETKNIPKNFGKAIINWMTKHEKYIQKITKVYQINIKDLIVFLKEKKTSLNTINELRNLWSEGYYSQIFRIISNLFLRKYSMSYIFNSRISNHFSHIKYRQRLREAILRPQCFKHIKQY